MKSSLFNSPRNLQRKSQPPHHHEIWEGLCQHVKCLYTWMKNRHTKYLLKYCNAILLPKSLQHFSYHNCKIEGCWIADDASKEFRSKFNCSVTKYLRNNCKLFYFSVLKQWNGNVQERIWKSDQRFDFCTILTLWPNWCSFSCRLKINKLQLQHKNIQNMTF